jgi:hypothetical protein
LAFAEAGLAAGLGLEDLLGFAGVAFGEGQRGLEGGKLLARDDEVDLYLVEGLTLEEGVGHAVHDFGVLFEDGVGRLVALVDEGANGDVDLLGGVVGVVARLADVATEEDFLLLLAVGERTEVGHTVLADHLAGEFGGADDVVAGTGGLASHEDLFGAASAHEDGELGVEIVLGDGVLVLFGQVHGDAEGHAARDDGDLVEWVGVLALGGDENVAGLVVGGVLLVVVREQHGLALGTHHDLVFCDFKVIHVNGLAVEAGCGESGLVDHVGQVGSAEARCAASEDVEVDVFRHRNLLGVDAEDLFAALDVGTVDDDATVEAAGTEQGRVEDVGTVGGGDENDAVVGLEAVHFDQELVEGLLALVVSTAEAGAAVTADSVDLIDEDDAGGVLLALLEEVADAGCADADEHLDEVRTGDGEEGDVGFTRNGAGEEGLAGAWRSDEQNALGDAAAELLELLSLAEELDDLLELFLGFVNAGDVLEGDLLLLHGEQTGAGLAEAHGLVAAGLHLAQEEEPEAKQEGKGCDGDQQAEPLVRALVLDGNVDAVVAECLIHVGIVARDGGVEDILRVVAVFAGDLGSVDGDFSDLALVGVVEELGEADVLFLRATRTLDDKLPEDEEARSHEDPDQNLFDGRVQANFLIFFWSAAAIGHRAGASQTRPAGRRSERRA